MNLGVKALAGAILLLVTVGSFLVGGCATPTGVDWDQRVGVYTMDQAIAELGDPYKSWPLEDGTQVVEWISETAVPETAGYAGRVNNPTRGPESALSGSRSVTQYRLLTLTFAKDGRLLYWNSSGPR